jgi:hypothetical protein
MCQNNVNGELKELKSTTIILEPRSVRGAGFQKEAKHAQ